MRAPAFSEISVTGTVAAVTPNSPAAGESTVDLGQNLAADFSDLNLYEEGSIRFLACPLRRGHAAPSSRAQATSSATTT